MTNLDSILKSRDITLLTKVCIVKPMFFSSSHLWMWELDHCKEGWAPKKWCFWTVVLEKTLESLLDCKEIKPAHPKGIQSWIFTERTDAEAETPILWLPDAKNWLTGKDPDAREDWRQEEKGITEDEMVGWHHWLDGYEFEQAPGVGHGHGGLACCSPWGCAESRTWLSDWTDVQQNVPCNLWKLGCHHKYFTSLMVDALKVLWKEGVQLWNTRRRWNYVWMSQSRKHQLSIVQELCLKFQNAEISLSDLW